MGEMYAVSLSGSLLPAFRPCWIMGEMSAVSLSGPFTTSFQTLLDNGGDVYRLLVWAFTTCFQAFAGNWGRCIFEFFWIEFEIFYLIKLINKKWYTCMNNNDITLNNHNANTGGETLPWNLKSNNIKKVWTWSNICLYLSPYHKKISSDVYTYIHKNINTKIHKNTI